MLAAVLPISPIISRQGFQLFVITESICLDVWSSTRLQGAPISSFKFLNSLDWPDDRAFDIVTANGIFYLLGDEAEARSQALIARMLLQWRKQRSRSTPSVPGRRGEVTASIMQIPRKC